MADANNQVSVNDRRSERHELGGRVTIRFGSDALIGDGQNISEQGVFFVAQGRVPVEVEVEGREGVFLGEVVRTENMGSGQIGIAVKFDEPNPALVDGLS
jgi:hypothetical protein